jgi:hypothetical protein
VILCKILGLNEPLVSSSAKWGHPVLSIFAVRSRDKPEEYQTQYLVCNKFSKKKKKKRHSLNSWANKPGIPTLHLLLWQEN